MTAPVLTRDTPLGDIHTALATSLRTDTSTTGVATLVKGAARIVEAQIPQNTAPPFVVIGSPSENEQSTFNRPGSSAAIFIDAYTPGGRDRETNLALYRAIKRRLHYKKLTLPSALHVMILGTVELLFSIPDEDGESMHASMVYRVIAVEQPRKVGEKRFDPRAIISEGRVVFNVPATAGDYAPERLVLRAPDGYTWINGRFTREAVSPAGTVFEEYVLKTGGDWRKDEDYVGVFSLMTANFVSIAFGPRTSVQVRARSGGTPGAIGVNAVATQQEPIITEQSVVFNVPATAGQYANEFFVFRSAGNVLTGHIAVVLESVMPTGAIMDIWALKPGGDPRNDAHYFYATNTIAGAGKGGNPTIWSRVVRLRMRSGGTPGTVTAHAIQTTRTGWS